MPRITYKRIIIRQFEQFLIAASLLELILDSNTDDSNGLDFQVGGLAYALLRFPYLSKTCCGVLYGSWPTSCVNADFFVSPDLFLNLDWLLGSLSHCTICSSSVVVQNRSSQRRSVEVIVVEIFKNNDQFTSRAANPFTWQNSMSDTSLFSRNLGRKKFGVVISNQK